MESMQQTLHSSGQSSEIHGRALYGYLCASCHEFVNPDLRKEPPKLHGLFLARTCLAGHPPLMNRCTTRLLRDCGPCPLLTSL